MTHRPPLPHFDRARAGEICRKLGIRLLVLFGSRATGSPPHGPASDLDLALALTAERRSGGLWDYHEALSRLFPGESLDLAFLNGADPLFRWEIMRAGLLLWGDADAYCELRAFAYKDFTDSANLRALEQTLSERKLARIQRLIRAAS